MSPVILCVDGRYYAVHFNRKLQCDGVQVSVSPDGRPVGPWRLLWRGDFFDAWVGPARRAAAACGAWLTTHRPTQHELDTAPSITEFQGPEAWAEDHGGEDYGDEDGAPAHIAEALSRMPGWRFVGLRGNRPGAVLYHDGESLWLIIDATADHPPVDEIVELGEEIIEEFGWSHRR